MAKLKAEVLKQMAGCRFLENESPEILNFFNEINQVSTDFSLFKLLGKCTDAQETVHVGMAIFLYKYESHFTAIVDLMCYLLIANGHDLLNQRKHAYVKSLEEIGDIDMYTKLEFLTAHNLAIFNRVEDRKLRNKIAHNQLILNDDKKAQEAWKEVMARTYELSGFIAQVLDVYTESAGELRRKYHKEK